MIYSCEISHLDDLFKEISSFEKLYLPVDENESLSSRYEVYSEGKKMSDRLNTVRSPKDFFFPQTENLMAFKTEGKKIDIIDVRQENEDFAVFGVRACDARAFKVLDNVFLKDVPDSYYADRRAHGTIISLACSRPVETCFCHTFDIDPTEPDGDVKSWKTEEKLYLEPVTGKGNKFIEKLLSVSDILKEEGTETPADVAKQKEQTEKIIKKLPLYSLSKEKFGAGKTEEYFNSPEWDKLSESCLGCGTCTFVCPTCQCYDIKDFKTNNGVIRYRCWDSCMYSDFTMMAAGQPRHHQKERFRQRFMHKLVYYPTDYDGLFSCVGCGRCLQKCPIHMNIAKVMKTLTPVSDGGDK